VLDRTLNALFLRLYAKNLSRSTRSEPEQACTDTEIQISTMLLLLIGAVILVAGSLLFPAYLVALMNGGRWAIAFLITLSLAVSYWVHKRFGAYERTPELARAHSTPGHIRWSDRLFWGTVIGWLVVMMVSLRHVRS
jgi:hypothetical protein